MKTSEFKVSVNDLLKSHNSSLTGRTKGVEMWTPPLLEVGGPHVSRLALPQLTSAAADRNGTNRIMRSVFSRVFGG